MQRAAQAAPERVGLRRLTPPRPLAALLAIIVVAGVAWALVVPPFQAPDELAHYAYAESLAQTFTIPSGGGPGASTDEVFADGSVGASRGAFFPQTSPPDWSQADWDHYLAVENGPGRPIAGNGGGFTSASGNPPFYYLFATVPYLLDRGGTVFGRLYAIRLAGVLLLVVTTLCAWLLAGEVLGRRRLSQLAAAAVAGLLPMSTFVSTAVTPDALLIPLWTLVLWLGARLINRGAGRVDAIAMCAAAAAAILTKATSYALVAPVLLALVVGWLRRPAAERGAALRRVVLAGLVLAVPVLAWVSLASKVGGLAITQTATSAVHPFNVRQFLSYVWQFYLPRLPFLTPFRTTAVPVRDIWLRQGTGIFGWLDVFLPGWMYRAGELAAGLIAVCTIGLLARPRPRRLSLATFLALTLVCLLGLLHITEYRTVIAGGGQFLQARYLLPAVGLLGLAIGLIVSRVPAGARAGVCGLVLTVLLGAQALSLTSIVHAYYL